MELERAQDTIRSQTSQGRQLADSSDALSRAQLQLANPFGGDDYEAQVQRLDQIRELQDILLQQREQSLQLNKELAEAPAEDKDRIRTKIAQQDLVNQKIREEALARQEVERSILKQKQVLEKVKPVADALASGITNFFTSVIDGSKSAEEAFADMLRGMASALAQTAAEMIAQYIAIGIAKAFAGMGKSTFGEQGTQIQNDFGNFFQGAVSGRASGGPVNANSPYIVGENGAELFIPGKSGTVVNNDDFADAAAALAGASGAFAATTKPWKWQWPPAARTLQQRLKLPQCRVPTPTSPLVRPPSASTPTASARWTSSPEKTP